MPPGSVPAHRGSAHRASPEGKCLRIALGGQTLQRGAARVSQPEHPRPLVERLPRGVVECAAENLISVVLGHFHQQRVTTAGDQAQKRRLEGPIRLGTSDQGRGRKFAATCPCR